MSSLSFLLKENLWNTKKFFQNPRKIYAVFPVITILAFWRIIFEYQRVLNFDPESNSLPLSLSLFSLITVAFAFIACYLGSTLVKRSKPTFWFLKYLVVVGIAVSPIALFFYFELDRTLAVSVVAFFRLIILVSVSESIAGFLIGQVEKRTQELESHQESLILAEEKFRTLVASHLHDNLQTRLVAVGIQLNQIRNSVDVHNSDKILTVINDIENIRAQEVRDFSKGITPNFQVDSLEISLQRLFSRNIDVITCHLHNMSALEAIKPHQPDFSLGIYRIVEQALLNSLTHGQATRFEVYAQNLNHELGLKISNNGALYGLHNSVEGHGFAVIDAWVTKFGGTWSITNQDAQVVIELNWKF